MKVFYNLYFSLMLLNVDYQTHWVAQMHAVYIFLSSPFHCAGETQITQLHSTKYRSFGKPLTLGSVASDLISLGVETHTSLSKKRTLTA